MTISVKNSAGTNTVISTIDDLLPVVSTSALQTAGNASLASILAKIIAAPATEAKQDSANTLLTELKTQTSLAASENRIGAVGGSTSYIDVTVTLDTSIYAAGDVLAATAVITNAMRVNDKTGILQSISIIDQDDQKADLKIILLSANVSVGAANAVPSISDVDAINVLGAPVLIDTSDYTDLGGVSIAGKDNIGKVVKPVTGTRNIYFAIINGATTPTFTAAGIKLRFGFLQD